MTALISVVIPCYKQAHFLSEAVGSLINQSHLEWELVIVNDGSPDNAGEIARSLIAAHPQHDIRLVEQVNQGLAEARNTGIRETRGEWIVCLDSDDLLDRDYLRKTLAAATDNTWADMVYVDIQCFGVRTDVWPCPDFNPLRQANGNGLHYSALYARRLWVALAGYRPIIPFGCEDYDFWLRCMALGFRPLRIPEALFLYRRHASPSMVDRMLVYKDEVHACIRSANPDVYAVDTILAAHHTLSRMRLAVRQEIDLHVARYPAFPQPLLWRGIAEQAAGNTDAALADLERARKLSHPSDWQVAFRLALLYRDLGDSRQVRECFAAAAAAMPPHPLRAYCLYQQRLLER